MKSKAALGLIIGLVFILGGFAIAAPIPSVYPAGFWINGKLIQGNAPTVEGYKVAFYNTTGTPSKNFAKCISDSDGNFRINAMADLGLTPLQVAQYYIGVVQEGGYGVSEGDNLVTFNVANLSDGYYNIDLKLLPGHGIPDPDDPGDIGLIRQTEIKREADQPNKGIILSWIYDPNLPPGQKADIWRLMGINRPYSSVDVWEQGATNVDSPWTDNFTTPMKVADGNNAYYRVVPTGTAQAKIFDVANNARTVGKVDVSFPKGYTLFSSPLWTDDMTIKTVIGGQLDKVAVGGDQIFDYNANLTTNDNGNWVGSAISFEKCRGYYLRILNTAKTLTFVGKVDLAPVTIDLDKGYNMIGCPYPTLKEVSATFIGSFQGAGGGTGDQVFDKAANLKTCTTGGWVGADYKFGIGDGFWYRNLDSKKYTWDLIP